MLAVNGLTKQFGKSWQSALKLKHAHCVQNLEKLNVVNQVLKIKMVCKSNSKTFLLWIFCLMQALTLLNCFLDVSNYRN